MKDEDAKKLVDEYLQKFFTGAFMFARVISGQFNDKHVNQEIDFARNLANAAVKTKSKANGPE